MEFLSTYSLFLLKLLSVVGAILVILLVFFALILRAKEKPKERLEITKLNEKYEEYHHALSHAVKHKHEFKEFLKLQKKETKKKIQSKEKNKRIFVLNFCGDIRASAVHALREEITAALTIAEKSDEIFVRLDSGGGLVNAYGLAASQLQRIRDAQIPLTVSIDKVAASGGYMMACVANTILAAPFAVVGSIGVLAQLPNFHRYLKKKYIDFEQLTAGEYKRTLSLFGENTEKGREKMQQEIEETHVLFKSFIKEHRKAIDIDQVATGEHWYGTRALELNLIDKLLTSDDYLLGASKTSDLYELRFTVKKTLGQRLTQGVTQTVDRLLFK